MEYNRDLYGSSKIDRKVINNEPALWLNSLVPVGL